MAKIDYFALEESLRSIIKANVSKLDEVQIEQDIMPSSDISKWACIYLERRDAPPDQQVISAGRVTVYQVRISIWVWVISGEIRTACNIRDDIIGDIETALMQNRSSFTDGEFWFEGGAFDSAVQEGTGAFCMGGELVVVIDTESTST